MAGPSASDVRSILSLPTSVSSTPTPSQPKKSGSTRKPEGISRELYSLIGDSVPTLAVAKPRLKQKPNLSGGGKVKWFVWPSMSKCFETLTGKVSAFDDDREWRAFKNGARQDGLQLNHWIKASTDPNADYSFAKYNIQTNVPTYSQDEYTRLLEDKEWTKEETDYLFGVVREYDSRFFIIHDRYEFPGGPERSLEDLKDRYYSVCRKLIRNRPWAGDETQKAQMISSFQFDKERETTRKKYLNSLSSRTPAQLAEEEALFIEIKRLEQNERKFKKDREDLLRTLMGVESGLDGLNIDEEGPMGSGGPVLGLDGKKKKKGHNAGDWETGSAGPSNVISLGQPVPKKTMARNAAFDALHCIYRMTPPPSATTSTKSAHTIVYLRGLKLPYPKPVALLPKVSAALAELGINSTRLVMPTKDNCEKLEQLMDATLGLIEVKRAVDRVEQEIRVMKLRLGINTGDESGNTSKSGSVAGGDDGGGGGGDAEPQTPMDVDMDEGAQTGNERDADADESASARAQSVVSVRSARGRRQASRRSVSVSSVDTSVPARSTKRQKHK
ncbi:hypothetical protein JAAARDRAFT_187584 [Jaapia argillacea MUCL 33604]|uniref:SWR1-complex protein 4 n=1 Tax=Jaapia argillacea MUCL 33604 TaxID=933084 RepID=A0A067QNK6_9AGAM|nr:hypothetical protein JAAARDRAFT_187584 [Jaapia argillacea MUCL 33604]